MCHVVSMTVIKKRTIGVYLGSMSKGIALFLAGLLQLSCKSSKSGCLELVIMSKHLETSFQPREAVTLSRRDCK